MSVLPAEQSATHRRRLRSIMPLLTSGSSAGNIGCKRPSSGSASVYRVVADINLGN